MASDESFSTICKKVEKINDKMDNLLSELRSILNDEDEYIEYFKRLWTESLLNDIHTKSFDCLSEVNKHKFIVKILKEYPFEEKIELHHCALCDEKDVETEKYGTVRIYAVCNFCEKEMCDNCDETINHDTDEQFTCKKCTTKLSEFKY